MSNPLTTVKRSYVEDCGLEGIDSHPGGAVVHGLHREKSSMANFTPVWAYVLCDALTKIEPMNRHKFVVAAVVVHEKTGEVLGGAVQLLPRNVMCAEEKVLQSLIKDVVEWRNCFLKDAKEVAYS